LPTSSPAAAVRRASDAHSAARGEWVSSAPTRLKSASYAQSSPDAIGHHSSRASSRHGRSCMLCGRASLVDRNTVIGTGQSGPQRGLAMPLPKAVVHEDRPARQPVRAYISYGLMASTDVGNPEVLGWRWCGIGPKPMTTVFVSRQSRGCLEARQQRTSGGQKILMAFVSVIHTPHTRGIPTKAQNTSAPMLRPPLPIP
jgi:hypothetical protein